MFFQNCIRPASMKRYITFSEVLQDAPLATVIMNEAGLIKTVNKSAESLFGYQQNDLADKNIDIIIPAGKETLTNKYSDVTDSPLLPKFYTDLTCRKKDGISFPAKITIRYYVSEENNIVIVFVEDLSNERILSEKFSKIFYKSPAAKVLSEAKSGAIVDVNQAFCRLTGYSKEELIGKTSVELGFFPDTADREVLIQSIREKGRAENIDLTTTTKSKKTINLLLSAELMDINGEYFLLTTCIDVTKLKKYEATLSKHAENLAELSEADTRLWRTNELQDGLEEILAFVVKLLNTTMGDIRLFEPERNTFRLSASRGLSSEFQSHFLDQSVQSDSVYGKALAKRLPIVISDIEQEDEFEFPDVFRREGVKGLLSIPLFLNGGLPLGTISVYKNISGPFDPLLVTMIELYARKVEGYIETRNINRTLEDLNEKLESKVNERTAQLSDALAREKELNDLKSRFVTMASHEFRTPLSTVTSSASLIEMYKNKSDYDKMDKHIARIKSSVGHLIQILNDFLSLGKLEEGKIELKMEVFDLKDFIIELIDEVQSLLKDGQEIEVQFANEIGLFESDSRILRNILFNLISNASKYSDPDKAIVIRCERTENEVFLQVKDQGIGIPIEDQKHLFDRFFRAKNVGNVQGTGLGLNIVKRYVELLSGSISVVSDYGNGTTFDVRIPLHSSR